MIKRQKTTIFTDAKETNTVFELKRIIEGITKRSPEDQQLFKDGDMLDDTKTLGDCGLTSNTAKAQAPAMLGLAFRECKSTLNTLTFSELKSWCTLYRAGVHCLIVVYPAERENTCLCMHTQLFSFFLIEGCK